MFDGVKYTLTPVVGEDELADQPTAETVPTEEAAPVETTEVTEPTTTEDAVVASSETTE